jgi:hypothetical protein
VDFFFPAKCNASHSVPLSYQCVPMYMNCCDAEIQLRPSGKKKSTECQMACTVDCSCMAYAYSLLGGCSLWHGNLTNMKDGYNGSEVGTLHFRLAASELESTSSSG